MFFSSWHSPGVPRLTISDMRSYCTHVMILNDRKRTPLVVCHKRLGYINAKEEKLRFIVSLVEREQFWENRGF